MRLPVRRDALSWTCNHWHHGLCYPACAHVGKNGISRTMAILNKSVLAIPSISCTSNPTPPLAPVWLKQARRAMREACWSGGCSPSLWEAGALPSSHCLHVGVQGDRAAAAFPGCRLPSDGMPGREGCGWAPGSPACLPAGRHRYLHQSTGQASHTKLARAKQMSPLSTAKEEMGWRQPLFFRIDKGRVGTQNSCLSCSKATP